MKKLARIMLLEQSDTEIDNDVYHDFGVVEDVLGN